jgi:hypothetical protein
MNDFSSCVSEFSKQFFHFQLVFGVHSVSFGIHELIAIVKLMLQKIDLFFFDGEFVLINLFEGLDFHGGAGVKVRQFGSSMSVRSRV